MQGAYSARYNFTKFLLPAAILLCFIVAYWTFYQKMSSRWSGGDNNYCYLVIPLFAYLLWDRRHKEAKGKGLKARGLKKDGRGRKNPPSSETAGLWRGKHEGRETKDDGRWTRQDEGFRFGEFTWSIWGLIPIIFSIGLILVGELGSVETLLYIGIWGCVVGLVMVLYGWRIRYLIFPLIILAFIVPLPPFVNRMLTFELKLAASTVATAMLRLTGVSVFQDGNIIDLGISQLQVVDACSGLR